MEALDVLLNRVSVPRLVEPAPDAAQREILFSAALRAPDHGQLRPYRFLTVEGDARNRMGDLLAEALIESGKGDDEKALEKAKQDATVQRVERQKPSPIAGLDAEITGGDADGSSRWAAASGPNGFITFQQVEHFRPPDLAWKSLAHAAASRLLGRRLGGIGEAGHRCWRHAARLSAELRSLLGLRRPCRTPVLSLYVELAMSVRPRIDVPSPEPVSSAPRSGGLHGRRLLADC